MVRCAALEVTLQWAAHVPGGWQTAHASDNALRCAGLLRARRTADSRSPREGLAVAPVEELTVNKDNSSAMKTAWAELLARSLRSTEARWTSAVRALMPSSAPISRLFRPWATPVRTSISRRVRVATPISPCLCQFGSFSERPPAKGLSNPCREWPGLIVCASVPVRADAGPTGYQCSAASSGNHDSRASRMMQAARNLSGQRRSVARNSRSTKASCSLHVPEASTHPDPCSARLVGFRSLSSHRLSRLIGLPDV